MDKFKKIAFQSVQFVFSLIKKFNWEQFFLVMLVLISPILVFYNLELNPRPWHDEGSYLTLAKTLSEDGIYAVRNSDGYQTFGPVQSIGPTVILPVALVYKYFGAGLLQGRIVSAAYALITLWVFFFAGYFLFGKRVALLAFVIMLGSPAASYLINGRQVLGEAPAIGFFLAGWLTWAHGVNNGKKWLFFLAGIFLGLAMITKSQYVILGMATLGLLVILDFVYYRQRMYMWLIVIGAIAVGCVVGWNIWQINYFGINVFQENAQKMGVLAKSTVGLNLHSIIDAVRFLLGIGSGHYYFFWGWPALLYVGFLSIKRDRQGLILSFLTVFTVLWILYFSFWIIPWYRYFFPAAVLTALFVAKLFFDLFDGLKTLGPDLLEEMRQLNLKSSITMSPRLLISMGTLAGLMTMTFGLVYQLQKVVRSDVFDTYGADEILNSSPPQFYAPQEVANFLNQNVEKGKIVETWERELGILTDQNYHYPDQVNLAQVHLRLYRGGNNEYGLDEDYFMQAHPDYLVIGWYSRLNNIYSPDAVNTFGEKIASFGSGEWRYDVYKINVP